MFTWFIVIVAVVLAGAAFLGAILHSRRFVWAGIGAAAGIVLLFVAASYFWHEAVLGVAIASLVLLALGVMLQQVAPAKALAGASTALILLFVFSWLAVQLADTFLFNKESPLQRWLNTEWPALPDGLDVFWPNSTAQIALATACLVTAAFLKRIYKAVLVFVGILLLTLQVPYLMQVGDWYGRLQLLMENPLILATIFFMALSFAVRILTPGKDPDDGRKP